MERLKQTISIAAAILAVSIALAGQPCAAQKADKPAAAQAGTADTRSDADILKLRQQLYERLSIVTEIPWYRIAAIDQYERTLSKAKPKLRPQLGDVSGVFIEEEQWAGPLNPDISDMSPASIQWFNGVGRDGDGDGIADRYNDLDLLYSVTSRLLQHGGSTEDDFAIGLWDYYRNSRAVQRIQQFAQIYAAHERLDLFEHAFPIPVGTNNYSYRSTWGNARSWGGRRSHEGTDIFAPYGIPVRSTCYGIIEVKGWNPYGGWRIGIRDLNNYYHYYAHLQGFDKSIGVGSLVNPGQVIGWVGSSGYGKPGTQGKFPPHLHYGVYRDRGLIEWSFDPYPLLKKWETDERKRLRSNG
ncbi:M23 family metallopeptidase [Paenibacillus sp. NPDC058174]|uniref:M23 family metallopeptidase n=1 Tax=Paenibacillus sp. NPDC058174 TaxID=3346366 RepID=UPI0036DEB92D